MQLALRDWNKERAALSSISSVLAQVHSCLPAALHCIHFLQLSSHALGFPDALAPIFL